MIRRLLLTVTALTVAALVAVACSGGDDGESAADDAGTDGTDAGQATDDAGTDGTDAGQATDDAGTDGGGADDGGGSADGGDGGDGGDGSTTDGAVDGPVILVSGLGAYWVTPDASEATPIDFDGMDGVSVGTEPVTDGTSTYVVTFRALEGQSFSSEAFVGRIDLATGATSILARIGVDRESDEAEELTEFGPMVAIDGDVWVYTQVFGESSGELLRFSPDSPDGPVASVSLSRPRGLHTDGQAIYAWTDSGLTVVDAATDSASVLVEGGQLLTDIEPSLDIASLLITRSGAELDDDALARVSEGLGLGGSSIDGTAFADGVFWVSVGELLQSSPETVLVEAVVGIDVRDGSVTSAVGTVREGTYFPEENSFAVGDSAIAAVGGVVWVVDRQDNGALLRVDPAAGSVEAVYRPCELPIECEDSRFILTDPDALWLDVTRYEVTGEGSRSGQIWVERIDVSTGDVAASASLESLIF